MSQKTIKVTGWILTAILGPLFTMSAMMKVSVQILLWGRAIVRFPELG